MKKIIYLIVLLALVIGVKEFLEKKAEDMVGDVYAMYEDGQYQKALKNLDNAEKFLGWTDAVEESDELRAQVKKRLRWQEKKKAADAENARIDAQWAARRKKEEAEWARQEENEKRKSLTFDEVRELQKRQ